MDKIIEARNLIKCYGKITAVDNISFSVNAGACFGLLGPNGAGKTTAIEIMESIKKPDSGDVFYKGEKITHSFKEKIGIQFQNTALQEFLTVRETLELFSRLYPRHKDLDEIIGICDLGEIIGRDNQKLSGGQSQRMLLGVALINDPDLLFLDEPTTGLDPQARRHFWNLVESIKRENKTIILTTHYMDEAEYLCDEIIIMNRGKIIEQGVPAELLKKHFGGVTIKIPRKNIKSKLNLSCPYETEIDMVKIRCDDADETIKELIGKGVTLSGLSVERQNLDDLFLKLTGSALEF